MKKISENLAFIALFLVGAIVLFNFWQMYSVSAALGQDMSPFSSSSSSKSASFKVKSGGDIVQNVINAVIPTGTPSYGEATGTSFDDPVNSLSILAKFDRQIPTSSLTPDELTRFVNVTSRISCEFCCGAPAVTDKSGRELCGCSHALSFRGLTKWILKNEPDKWTDEEILAELTKWKALYYPKNMVQKGVAAVENGLELSPAVLNDRDLLNKLKSGDVSNVGINDLPSMVGGC